MDILFFHWYNLPAFQEYTIDVFLSMKFISRLWILMMVALGVQISFAQTAPDGWMRVQSDDGEFSVEVPASHKFFSNADGFWVSAGGSSDDFQIRNMYMLNTFFQGSLLSFEMYDAKKGALDALYHDDTYDKGDNQIKTTIKNGTYSIKQVVTKGAKSYVIRQYFASKNHIYILTAAARNGETTEMRRFLDSLEVREDTSTGSPSGQSSTPFSKLHVEDIPIEMRLEDAKAAADKKDPKNTTPRAPDPTVDSVVIVAKAKAAYVNAARENRDAGIIMMKMTFTENGNISKIQVLKTLPDGLLRQTVFAALRIKFLPKQKDGKPVTVALTFEYGFHIG